MKKLLPIIIIICLVLSFQVATAANNTGKSLTKTTTIERLKDGSSYITVIKEVPRNSLSINTYSAKSKTGSKTLYFRNSKNKALWSVTVSGTFTYGNGSSKCIYAAPSANAISPAWSISSLSGTTHKNSTSAIASASKKQNGTFVHSRTKTVTLTCSSSGALT